MDVFIKMTESTQLMFLYLKHTLCVIDGYINEIKLTVILYSVYVLQLLIDIMYCHTILFYDIIQIYSY